MEELDFEVKLTSNSIDRCPGLKICINDSVYFSGEVLGENIVTFKASITDDFNLNISYAGNNPQDLQRLSFKMKVINLCMLRKKVC